jgi:hypothetical protein
MRSSKAAIELQGLLRHYRAMMWVALVMTLVLFAA